MNLFFRRIQVSALVLGVTVAMGSQAAAPDIIKERQQGLKDMGAAFKTVRDELTGGKDVAKIKVASATISKVARSMDKWFPAGSGTEAGVKTAAKSEIWSDAATFTAARQRLVDEAAKFAALAEAGDIAAIGGGVRGLGGACKNCHDNFRVKED
jgi:cytochrome c556